jgi:hypothetical protein
MESSDAVHQLERDLRGIFGGRLQSIAIYGERARARQKSDHHAAHAASDQTPIRTMVVVAAITETDLRACAARAAAWHDAGLATPLLLASLEFERSLDAFPLEFGAILADHRVVSGPDPFGVLTVDPADIRRACEVQARSHLLHLREGYLETRGRADALSVLIVQSAPALTALVTSVARLETQTASDAAAAARHAERTLGVPPGAIADIVALAGVQEISSPQAERLFPPYLDAVERLVAYVDGWSARE